MNKFKYIFSTLLMIPLLQGCFEFKTSSSSSSNSLNIPNSSSSSSLNSSLESSQKTDIIDFNEYNVKTFVYGDTYNLGNVEQAFFPMDEVYQSLGLNNDGDIFIVDDINKYVTLYTSLTLVCFDLLPEDQANKSFLDEVTLAIRRTASSPNRIKVKYYDDIINNKLLAIEEELDISDLCVGEKCIDIISIPKDKFIIYYPEYIPNIIHMEKVYYSGNKEVLIDNNNLDVIDKTSFIDFNSFSYEGSLQELFNAPFSDEIIREYFTVMNYVRIEPITTPLYDNIEFKDLFIENKKIYLTNIYNCNDNVAGDAALKYYNHLVLMPKHWKDMMYKTPYIDMVVNQEYLNSKDYILDYANVYNIKLAYQDSLYNDGYKEYVSVKEIHIETAYKEFANSTAVKITCDHFDFTEAIWEERIGEYSIIYNNGNRIYIYFEGYLYTVTDAYEKEIITIEDVRILANKTSY